jgi:mono/diheme cytochrome c family protein
MTIRAVTLAFGGAVLALAGCDATPAARPTGAEDYAMYCATCHGVDGRGDGAKVADLTGIAARNGGSFPRARVMTQIWGYARATPTPGMPAFSTLLQSETVLYDSGDGIATPTPLRLVQLSEYLEALGAPG